MNENKLQESNCAGFFHWPPIWINPEKQSLANANDYAPADEWIHQFQCGVKMKVSTIGVFIFDFSEWFHGVLNDLGKWQTTVFARMRFMNLILSCIYSDYESDGKRYIPKTFIDSETYCFARQFHTDPYELGCSDAQHVLNKENIRRHGARNVFDTAINMSNVINGCNTVDLVLKKKPEDAANMADLVLHAYHLLEREKYEASLIASWTVTEWCINFLWSQFIQSRAEFHKETNSNEAFVNSERIDRLNGRDFTMSVITEVLSLNGVLSFQEYKQLNHIRKVRNKRMHECIPVSLQDADKAYHLSEAFLTNADVVNIRLQLSPSKVLPMAFDS
jgi:hypothetical protein